MSALRLQRPYLAGKPVRLTIDPQNLLATSALPRCPDCGFFARPNILMFNDWEWIASRADQQSEKFHDWKQATRHSDLVIIEIGAGVSVGKVRFTSQTFKGTLIRINPQGPSNTISIAMPGLAALTAIEEILQSRY
jgi:NAD-dependent SIR2 family protein deacetylase